MHRAIAATLRYGTTTPQSVILHEFKQIMGCPTAAASKYTSG